MSRDLPACRCDENEGVGVSRPDALSTQDDPGSVDAGPSVIRPACDWARPRISIPPRAFALFRRHKGSCMQRSERGGGRVLAGSFGTQADLPAINKTPKPVDHSPHFACGRPRYWRRERDGPLLPICGPSGVSGAESTFLARQRIPTKCHPVGSAVGGERGIPSGSVRCGETWGSPCRTTSEYINGDPGPGSWGLGRVSSWCCSILQAGKRTSPKN